MTFSLVFRWISLCGVLALMACGADPTCKDGCDKVRSCSLSTSGLSCSSTTTGCTTPDNSCAQCLSDKSCTEIRAGGCASACPGYRP
jgi:hypothetical protein